MPSQEAYIEETASGPSPHADSAAPYSAERSPSAKLLSPIIETYGLCMSYAVHTPVLRDLTLSIQPHERVALIGANGSGKSTLLKCLIGLTPVSAGNITALGQKFERMPTVDQRRRLRRQVGFVFQYHGLVKRLSVLSNVIHGLLGTPGSWRASVQMLAPKTWREAAMEALAAVNLEHKALDRADSLSGGQQQRVAIARAFIRKPRLIIADEPAASLDPSAGRDVMALFSGLARDHGITLLYTSHDMDHALQFSDRIVALKNRAILFDSPSERVTQAMLSEVFDG